MAVYTLAPRTPTRQRWMEAGTGQVDILPLTVSFVSPSSHADGRWCGAELSPRSRALTEQEVKQPGRGSH